jgi:formylglycine-generating enzyme required for sulfatase activity
VGSAERAWKWAKRNPGRAAAIAAAVAVVVAGVVTAFQLEKKRLNDLRATRAEALVQALGVADTAGVPLLVGSLLPAPAVAVGKDWYVTGEEQTFAVVRGPVEFTIGSPPTEPGRVAVNEPDGGRGEPTHRKRIGRSFAIATREVTVEQFLRVRPNHDWIRRYSPGPDTPTVAVPWYEAAEYCNWLSAREGIPPDQWCYQPNKAGKYGDGMGIRPGHLKLTGYRLPTEAEWEYACRSGAVTARYYGRGDELFARYGWFVKTADDRAWPVGRLRPNDRGLFDPLGNASEWSEDPGVPYDTGQREDLDNIKLLLVEERTFRPLRSGSFYDPPVYLRCAVRYYVRPGIRNDTVSFRPARTLPD